MTARSLVAVAVLASGCGPRDGGAPEDAGVSTLELEPPSVSITVPLRSSVAQRFTVWGVTEAGERVDVTATCALALDPSFGAVDAATAKFLPHGGRTTLEARCAAGAASAPIELTVGGELIVAPAPASAPALFGAATLGADPARQPAISYPLDAAVAPRNMPPIEVQWSAAGNDLFRVRARSAYVAVDVYTTSVASLLAEADWGAIVTAASGSSLEFTVEGVSQAAPESRYASAPVTLRVARDAIDRTAIYYWASTQGSILEQTFGALGAPRLVKDRCTSCHSVSRAGSRIGYSRCVANDCGELFAGFLKRAPGTQGWVETMNADDKALRGSYTTFAPVGNPFPDDAQSVAIVATASPARLGLYDPDTGQPIASNLEAQSVRGPGEPRSATMPDWSPDGAAVVFASTPNPGQWIDVSNSRIASMAYAYQGGQHVFGDPQLLIADPITLQDPATSQPLVYDNFFFPSFSPDGALVVFNAARAAWRDFADARTPGQRLMLTTATGAWVADLTALNGGFDDRDITWARWAPTIGSDYLWIVFSSQRDYGHRLTEASSATSCTATGVRQCKQIWISAIARASLDGTADPSAPPMWLPGQDLGAANISPFWSVPVGLQ